MGKLRMAMPFPHCMLLGDMAHVLVLWAAEYSTQIGSCTRDIDNAERNVGNLS